MNNINEKAILIIDDDAAMLRALSKVLSGEGAVVASASLGGGDNGAFGGQPGTL